jgi:hypothetical protein
MDHSYHQRIDSTSKRRRIDHESEILSHDPVVTSMEAQLYIPMVVIFRQVLSNNRAKPLLTRSEAQSMLRMNMLSQEIDVLVQLSSEAFNKKLWCNNIEATLVSHPVLRALLPLLHCHGKKKPEKALAYIQQELSRALHEITTLSNMMHQSADQNYTLSESLLDALGGNSLAEEKRLLGDLEEEICKRCYELLQMTETHITSQSSSPMSMKEFCTKLFGEITLEPKGTHMLTILEEEWQGAQNEKESVSEDKEATEISPQLILPSDVHRSLSTTIMSTASIQPLESLIKITKNKQWETATTSSSEGAKSVSSATDKDGSELDADTMDDVSLLSPSDKPVALESITITSQADAIKDAVSQSLQTPNYTSNDYEVYCDEPGISSFHTAAKIEYHRTDSQENRMDAAHTLICGARKPFQLTNVDEPVRRSLQTTKSETKVDSNDFKMKTCQQVITSTTRGTQGHSLQTDSLLFPNNAEQSDDESHFHNINLQTRLTTKSPPLFESDDEQPIPNTQNAIHALAGLGYSHI